MCAGSGDARSVKWLGRLPEWFFLLLGQERHVQVPAPLAGFEFLVKLLVSVWGRRVGLGHLHPVGARVPLPRKDSHASTWWRGRRCVL
jgi:hypothetical protein